MYSTSNVAVSTVLAIILLTNVLIVVTLSKTKSFSRATKLHISLFTICDGITGMLLGTRFLMESNGYSLPFIACKLIVAIISSTASAMFGIYISMTMECLSMVSIAGLLYGWNCLRPKSWKITRKGLINIFIIMVISTDSIIALILSAKPNNDEEYRCMFTSEAVLHPVALRFWACQSFVLFNANIILLIWLMIQIKQAEKRSRALLNRKSKSSENFEARKKVGLNVKCSESKAGASNMSNRQHSVSTHSTNNAIPLNVTAMMKTQNYASSFGNRNLRKITDDRSGTLGTYGNHLRKEPSSNLPSSQSTHMNRKRKSSVYLILLSALFYTICMAPYVYMIMLYAFCPGRCGIDKLFFKLVLIIL